MKKLFITEKPSVAMEFAKALGISNRKDGYIEGGDYVITWCVGHLVTMSYPEAYGKEYAEWRMETLPFIPQTFKYEIIDSVRDQFRVVSDQMKRSDIDTIYYSGDSAREGEYIQRLIRMLVKPTGKEERRVWIDSQTKDEILRGIKTAKLLTEYDALSDAAYMRAAEDYLFGINLSRAYSIKYGRLFNNAAGTEKYEAFAVGRVMTCVLGLIVERERLIKSAKEIPFYGVKARLQNGIECEWKTTEQSAYFESPALYKSGAFKEKSYAEAFINKQISGAMILKEKKITTEIKGAPLLYNLAELQNECSQQLKISPDKTLEVVQSLYEKKMVTYPRTDARVLTTAISREISKNLQGLKNIPGLEKATEYALSQNPESIGRTKYTDDKQVSDHYAIIPTGEGMPQTLSSLERSVYMMIASRFVSVFQPPAEFEKITCTFVNGKETYTCSTKYMTSAGFLELYNKGDSDDSIFKAMDSLKEGAEYEAQYCVAEGKTSPPKRYTSGSMILTMENAGQLIEDQELRSQIKGSGIGTSATRAETLKKLIRNKYIELNDKTQVLTPGKRGEIIYDIVKSITPSLLRPEMTANWEKGLSMVENRNISKEAYFEKLAAYITREVNAVKNSDEKAIVGQFPNVKATTGTTGYSAKPKIQKFTNSVPKTIPDICPHCGGKIRALTKQTPEGSVVWTYGCSKCAAKVPTTIAGLSLSNEQIAALLCTGKTAKIEGFHKKSGGTFSAKLQVNKEWEVSFSF